MIPSNLRFLLLGALALGAGAASFFVESSWITAALAVVSIGCLLTFIMLSIARVQKKTNAAIRTGGRRSAPR